MRIARSQNTCYALRYDKTGSRLCPARAWTVVTRSSGVLALVGLSPVIKRRVLIGVLNGPKFAMRNAIKMVVRE